MAQLFSSIHTESTHDLWVQSRQFNLDISRISGSSVRLTVQRPADLDIVDGAVILFGVKALTPNEYPIDGFAYDTPSLVYGDALASKINNFQVVGFYSDALSLPFPTSTLNSDGSELTFSIDITGVLPDVVYYASIHACSNVLQYYPLGIQSYPLESAQIEKAVQSFTGSIPTLSTAPTEPTPGFVYFDKGLGIVQYWDSTRSTWIPTRSDSILSGESTPGSLGAVYLRASDLKIFDGKKWIIGTPANLQFRAPASTWVPYTKISLVLELPDTANAGDVFYNYTSETIQYWDGAQFQIPTSSTALFNTGSAIVPAFTVPFKLEPADLIAPYIGMLFYNTVLKQLLVWTGLNWIHANTSQEGTPTSDKFGIGNDGTYDQRIRMISILKSQLGYPVQCVELTEEQFNIAIDNALDTYRQLCIGAYEQRFLTYQLIKDQQVYFLNSPIDRTDAVVSVMKVHRLNLLGVNGAGPDNTWGMAFAQQFSQIIGGGGNLLDTHLINQWSEEFTKMFAGDIPFLWNEARRELVLKRSIRQNERIVLEVELERSEQELMSDRWCKQFLQNWALAECKEYLGLIRSKYTSGTPGPSGNISLNGDMLIQEARTDFAELKEALLNYEYQNAEHGSVSFLIG